MGFVRKFLVNERVGAHALSELPGPSCGRNGYDDELYGVSNLGHR
jgi:hypothetical protein